MDAVAGFSCCYKLCRGDSPVHIVGQLGGHVGAHASALKVIGSLNVSYVGAALNCFMRVHHGPTKFAV